MLLKLRLLVLFVQIKLTLQLRQIFVVLSFNKFDFFFKRLRSGSLFLRNFKLLRKLITLVLQLLNLLLLHCDELIHPSVFLFQLLYLLCVLLTGMRNLALFIFLQLVLNSFYV
jgi:hypothetical protein